MHSWALGFGLCLEVGVATYGGWWIGNYLDQSYGWHPYGSATGVILFLAVSLWHLIYILRRQEAAVKRNGKS